MAIGVFWVLRSEFLIIDVDHNYPTMLVGVRSHDLGWIFARDKILSDSEYQRALQVFQENGYDTSQFSKVPQLPEHIGMAGFQTVE